MPPLMHLRCPGQPGRGPLGVQDSSSGSTGNWKKRAWLASPRRPVPVNQTLRRDPRHRSLSPGLILRPGRARACPGKVTWMADEPGHDRAGDLFTLQGLALP